MNGDISLSQSLGGLRIANPDEDASSPSPPPPQQPEDTASASAQNPPSSSHSASSTVNDKQRLHLLPQVEPESSSALGFDPNEFSTASNSASQVQLPPLPAQMPSCNSTLTHGQSMPAATQPPAPFNPAAASASNPGRSYGVPPNATGRPMSNLYSHPNVSSSSAISVQGTYRYRDDALGQPPGSSISRSASSRVPPATSSGFPTRESSRRDRTYPPVQGLPSANGLPPPRRSSRRMPPESVPGGRIPALMQGGGGPYGIEGGPLPSSEEWKERGAAVGVRQDIDASGKPVQRVVKKGVKDFNFGRTLGEGSYSTVLAATDRHTGREYAIKVLDKRHIIKEKKVKYVTIEKDTLNRLTEHPGIVRLYYTFQDERSLYFVLDLATGGELLGFLKKTGTFDEECTRFYGAQILDAIEYMHSRGVIHRDLKPENVLLDDQMHVKITDFGTAKILDKKPANGDGFSGDPLEGIESDRAVSFVGTAEYVSPELLTDKNACKASDLWAFGCIVYQLLAGRPPFKAANEYQTFQKIVGLEYAFPDGFPAVARDLVERLLVLDPAKRLPIEHIKNHQFFEGIKWGKGLWKQKAPKLKSYVPPAQEPIRLNAPATVSAAPSNGQLRPPPPSRLITELPPPSQLDIEWSPVLTKSNERILKLGNLVVTSSAGPHSPNGKSGDGDTPKKFSRFFGGNTTKKRQRLVMITSSARIVMAAAGGDEKKTKMEIDLLSGGTTWKSFQDSKGLTCWCVDMRDKHVIFEDPKATTSDPDGSKYSCQEWLDTLERAKEMAISMSITNSYAGDSGFNDITSTISSPTSTLGGEAAIEGVNIPRNRHLRKDHDDTDSIKGRKRFSKRHSKNGLAAVF